VSFLRQETIRRDAEASVGEGAALSVCSQSPTLSLRACARLLGAIGVQLGKKKTALQRLQGSLNPFSRFDFGLLSGLSQARNGKPRSPARMRLFEHPDFDNRRSSRRRSIFASRLAGAIIEKDYYVTEALRIISATADDKVIFKGAQPSKGWNLIHTVFGRHHLFLDPLAFRPASERTPIDRELRKLRDAVGAHAALTFVENESQPSVDSGGTTASLMRNVSAAPAKWPIEFCWKRAPRAVVSRPLSLNSVLTLASF